MLDFVTGWKDYLLGSKNVAINVKPAAKLETEANSENKNADKYNVKINGGWVGYGNLHRIKVAVDISTGGSEVPGVAVNFLHRPAEVNVETKGSIFTGFTIDDIDVTLAYRDRGLVISALEKALSLIK